MFIFRGINCNNQLRYYLWEGLADNVFEFEEMSLENIKRKIDSECGSLKKLQLKDMEAEFIQWQVQLEIVLYYFCHMRV